MSLTLRPQLNLCDYSSQNRVTGTKVSSYIDIDDTVLLGSDVGNKNGHQ